MQTHVNSGWQHLEPAFKEAVLSKASADAFARPDPRVMLDALEHPETRFQGNATEQRRILLTSLAAAYQDPIRFLWKIQWCCRMMWSPSLRYG